MSNDKTRLIKGQTSKEGIRSHLSQNRLYVTRVETANVGNFIIRIGEGSVLCRRKSELTLTMMVRRDAAMVSEREEPSF